MANILFVSAIGHPGEPSAQHLAVAFYDNGRLIKRYSPLDVLKDPARAPRSVSHYRWLKDLNGFYKETEMFSFVTVENIEYTFDVTTGKLLFEEPVKSTGILLDVNLSLTTTSHNKSLDASGISGLVIDNLAVTWLSPAASTQPFDGFFSFHTCCRCQLLRVVPGATTDRA